MLGKVYQINTIDSYEGEILHQELEIYPLANPDSKIDVVINYLNMLENKAPLLRNPSIHNYYENGFRIELINTSIEFHFDNKKLTQIDFSIKQGSDIRAMANKWFSYQFTNRKESIGFIFHELILIPSAFFSPDLTIVHASAIDDNGAVLFGGTGGVGKTSLELELCNTYNKSFFADDIVVLNNKGDAFPNLSYPKIYGYNLVNNDELRRKIFKKASIPNKIHWQARKAIDPSIVRRRVNPKELYRNVTQESIKLKAFYILVKDGNVNQIEMNQVSSAEASKLNKLVIETEYHIFYKHMLWDEFNSVVDERTAHLKYSDLIDRIDHNLINALTNVKTFLLRIPINIDHKDYLKQMSELITANSKT